MARIINPTLAFLVLGFVVGATGRSLPTAMVGEIATPPVPARIPSPPLATPLRTAFSSPTHKMGQVVSLVMAGDVMLGRYVSRIIARRGTAYPFAPVRDMLAGADVAFANLESPLTTAEKVAQGHDLRAGPPAAQALAEAGFDVVSLANNHCSDCGEEGLLETMAALQGAGIAYIGAGRNRAEAHTPLVMEVKGLKLAFLAYDDTGGSCAATADRAGSAHLELEQGQAGITMARQEADVVIVSLHWGREYSSHPTDRQHEMAKELANGGADIVVGHHPHVLGPIEFLTLFLRKKPRNQFRNWHHEFIGLVFAIDAPRLRS